ncbi:MAG: S41 family peptidase [Candidatus Paceibacterota bacterium]
MKISRKRVFLVILIFILIGGSGGAGFLYGVRVGWKKNLPDPFEKIIKKEKPVVLPDADMSIFWETWKKILEKYVDRDKLDPNKNIEGATKGLVESLDDPFSEFLNAEETKALKEDLSGEFFGVGMEISKKDGAIVVVAPLPNSPAEKAGLLPGDQIIKVDDKEVLKMSTAEVAKLIRGPKGTKVKITIYRASLNKTLDFELIRDKIVVPSFSYQFLEDGIAYLKFYNFNQPLLLEFYLNSFEILSKNPKGLIIDLRNNPGGYLDVVVEIAGWFLEKSAVILKEDFGNDNIKLYKNDRDGIFKNIPTVVLINKGTASASEILAGALRDNRSIKLIGEKSFGKGSVQELVSLSNNNSLKITIAHWLTPKGHLLDKNGLEPDVEIENPQEFLGTYEKLNLEKDVQLKKALEVLKEEISKK